MKFALSTDSGAEAFTAQRLADSVYTIPFGIIENNGQPRRADLYDNDADYRYIVEHVEYMTVHPPTPDDYEEYFDEIFETGRQEILHIAASSGLYASYKNAVKAAKNTLVKFPGRGIYILDSRSISAGQRLLLDTAKALRDHRDAPAAQVYTALEKLTPQIATLLLPFDTDYFLSHSDAASKVNLGSILNLYPLLELDKHGTVQIVRTVKGLAAARNAVASFYSDHVLSDISRSLYLSTTDFPWAQTLLKAISTEFHSANLDTFWAGAPLSADFGPRVFCAAFYAQNAGNFSEKARAL